ncbi:alpha/beta hydrolase [Calidifontibacter terrae]
MRAASAATAFTIAAALAACEGGSKVAATSPASSSSNSATGSASTAQGATSASAKTDQLSPTGADLAKYTSQKPQWAKANCTADVRDLTSFSLRDLAPVNNRTVCAKVTVPKDYSDPSKGDLQVMVTRTPASKSKGAPVLMVNPGGPGAPAGSFSVITSALAPLGADHDVVGVDPRGVGGGTRVTCEFYGSKSKDARTISPSDISLEQAAAKKTVDDCVAKNGNLLPYITSDNTARDHALVLGLLGKKQMDYYGVSAGTWLGARFATLFPGMVGRFVLDSNTEFTGTFAESFGTQPMSFQRRFDQQLLPWLARQDAAYGLGSTPEQVKASYEAIRKAAGDGNIKPFYPDAIDNVVAHTLYSDRGFQSAGALLSLLNRARNGDQQALATAKSAAASSGDSSDDSLNEATVFTAIRCNDTAWNKDPNSYVATAQQDGPKYPLVGYDSVANECAYWPYQPSTTTIDLSKGPKILMVQTEDDPATAYEGALEAHKAAPNTVLLSVDNQGNHGAVLGGGNLCVEKVAYEFLQQGKELPQDSVCPGIPLPRESAVHPVGITPAGGALTMPKDPTPQWKKLLLAVLGSILDELLTPKSGAPRG